MCNVLVSEWSGNRFQSNLCLCHCCRQKKKQPLEISPITSDGFSALIHAPKVAPPPYGYHGNSMIKSKGSVSNDLTSKEAEFWAPDASSGHSAAQSTLKRFFLSLSISTSSPEGAPIPKLTWCTCKHQSSNDGPNNGLKILADLLVIFIYMSSLSYEISNHFYPPLRIENLFV